MPLVADNAQIVLLDFQAQLAAQVPEYAAAYKRAQQLAALGQHLQVPCFLAHLPSAPWGVPEAALAAACAKTVLRTHLCAFDADANDCGLHDLLLPPARPRAQGSNARSLPKHLQRPATAREPERTEIVLAGCHTHGSVLQTALALLEAEWDVVVVTDACAARTSRDHDAALDRLAAQGAELVTLEMLAWEWAGDTSSSAHTALTALLG